jgi:hypothetical protein
MQKRWKSDKIINASLTEVLRGREWVQLPWSALAVGDIVKVSRGADVTLPPPRITHLDFHHSGIVAGIKAVHGPAWLRVSGRLRSRFAEPVDFI